MPTNPTEVPHNNVLSKLGTPCRGPQLIPRSPMYNRICNSKGPGIVFRNCEKVMVAPFSEAQEVSDQPERIPAHQVGTDPSTWNRTLCKPCRDVVAVFVAGHEAASMRRAKVNLCGNCQSYEEVRAGGQAVDTCTCAATFARQWICFKCRAHNNIVYLKSCDPALDFYRHVFRNQKGQIIFDANRKSRDDTNNSSCRCGRTGPRHGAPSTATICVVCKGISVAATSRRISPCLRLQPPVDFTPIQ